MARYWPMLMVVFWPRLRPPTPPFVAILLYNRNEVKRHVILCFRIPCVFNQFQSYDNIAEKGCAGGLKQLKKNLI